jgi:hypothetical protein
MARVLAGAMGGPAPINTEDTPLRACHLDQCARPRGDGLAVRIVPVCRLGIWGTVAGTPDCPYPVGGTGEGGRCMPDSPSRVISRWALDAVSAPHITASCPL